MPTGSGKRRKCGLEGLSGIEEVSSLITAPVGLQPDQMVEAYYDTLEDGTPKDPKAYQTAIRADAEKMQMLDEDPEAKAIVLGDDMHAFQELIRGAYQMEKKRLEKESKGMAERTIEAQRASAPVPRDTVQLYKQLYDSGLQYGPAFRLLRNVHIPDILEEPQASAVE